MCFIVGKCLRSLWVPFSFSQLASDSGLHILFQFDKWSFESNWENLQIKKGKGTKLFHLWMVENRCPFLVISATKGAFFWLNHSLFVTFPTVTYIPSLSLSLSSPTPTMSRISYDCPTLFFSFFALNKLLFGIWLVSG